MPDLITRSLFVALCLMLTTQAPAAPVPMPTGDAGWVEAGRVYFNDSELLQITVTMDPADLQAMLNNPFDNTYYNCSVHLLSSEVDAIIEDVAIRPRGNTSRSAIKKSWKLKFNEFVPGREVFGLEKLNINGHQNDPSVVRGKLAWDVYNQFGVPSPRASMARMIINDGSLVDDVFVNVEQIDDEFLAAWFDDDTGNLYQCTYKGERADLRYVPPGAASAYAGLGSLTYELENDSGANQHQDLADFIAFIENADDATFTAEIASRFSVDAFLRSLAVDCVNGHWDNLWYGANNYFLYVYPDTGRVEYIPYDLDNTYGIDFFSTDWAARPASSFGDNGFGWDFGSSFGGGAEPPLVRRILAIDAYHDQYLRYVRELVGAIGEPSEPTETVYTDSLGDTFNAGSDPHFDIDAVTLTNDLSELLAQVQVDGQIDVGGETDQARIVLFFDTGPGGSTSNPWGREINTDTQADYFLGSWTDNGGGFIFYAWDGSGWDQRHASFNNPAGFDQDLSDKTEGIARYTLPLDAMGLSDGDSFYFDVVTTNDRGADTEPGVDHLSNANQATPNYDTPSQSGEYLFHTLEAFDPGSVDTVETIFTLGTRGVYIDALRDTLEPYAFTGSYAGGFADYGYTAMDFYNSFDSPTSYSGGSPWAWGVKPYIQARTDYLRANVPPIASLPKLAINEVLASNDMIVMDEAGDYEDYIEIYNADDEAIDLSGMHLSDSPFDPLAWVFPEGTVLAPGAFLIVWCDDEPGEGPLHATFKLSAGGESAVLSHRAEAGSVLIDSVSFPGLLPDESYGRAPDGSESFEVFCAVTPGFENDPRDDCFTDPDPTPAVFVNEWLASNDGVVVDEFGDADDFIELYNAEPTTIDLGGRYLSDDLTDRTKWEIPAGVSIEPGGYLVIWADDEPEQGPLHATFKLSAGGEAVGLFDRDGNQLAQIDAVTYTGQETDISEGRAPDASDCRQFFAPTPGAPNPLGIADLASPLGELNFFDVSSFLTLYAAGDLSVDFDGDGQTNFFDVSAFLTAYSVPCPE
ncbi:MAG: CotH kinase family protein [Phycisphaerales bacterium JB052]